MPGSDAGQFEGVGTAQRGTAEHAILVSGIARILRNALQLNREGSTTRDGRCTLEHIHCETAAMRWLFLLLAAGRAASWQHETRVARCKPRQAALKDTFEARMMSVAGKDELRRALSADGFVSAKAVDVTRAVREICQLQD